MAQPNQQVINRMCRHAYELVLTLTFAVLVLAIPHRLATHHINIAQTLPDDRVVQIADS